ncbi:hypothetical protein G7077_08825 [Sphingomonas piscis]|uniref:Polyhydroxyalkanoic acid system protein n=1 Tax=Sphingomonas piscis TaxID=2714943 RepID=A0A6G7YQG3_9SPHN|nr:polyhydroxyalkanoic acid system family protein [Sphingomonas piscis]QIK78985.1 hypothetical protein G7077_08825 [Sphingomonas piscis]
MNQPISVDLPHSLGKDEARRRIANNIHKLKDHLPGGASHTNATWEGDEMRLNVGAMGQSIDARILVQEKVVTCRIVLPGLLGMFSGPIEAMLRSKGSDVLLEDHSKS